MFSQSSFSEAPFSSENVRIISVQKDVSFLWNVLKAIQKDSVIKFNDRALVTITRQLIYNIHTLVSKNISLVFNERALVNNTKQLIYNVRQLVQQDTSILFNDRVLANQFKQLVYNVNQLAQKDTSILFNNLSVVTVDRSIVFNTMYLVDKSTGLIWDLRSLTQKDLTILFNLVQPVLNTKDFTLSVLLNRDFDLFMITRTVDLTLPLVEADVQNIELFVKRNAEFTLELFEPDASFTFTSLKAPE